MVLFTQKGVLLDQDSVWFRARQPHTTRPCVSPTRTGRSELVLQARDSDR